MSESKMGIFHGYIYQPNRITNAIYNYSLSQERAFNAVMYYLQDAITANRNGKQYLQLPMFKDYENSSYIKLRIPLKELSIPQNYEHVKRSLKALASILVEIPYRNEKNNEERLLYAGLMNVGFPKENDRSSYVLIEIDKRVAALLIEMEKNEYGAPIQYTKFLYHIAQRASNKYTSRIYKLICSWRKKGIFEIPLDTFRERLGLEKKYRYYNEIKKNILIPVQKQLFEKADCWFDCESEDFITKHGNTVTKLNFKIITKELIAMETSRNDLIINSLRTHFSFKDTHIDQLKAIIKNTPYVNLMVKLAELQTFCNKHPTKITDRTMYVLKSLLNEF